MIIVTVSLDDYSTFISTYNCKNGKHFCPSPIIYLSDRCFVNFRYFFTASTEKQKYVNKHVFDSNIFKCLITFLQRRFFVSAYVPQVSPAISGVKPPPYYSIKNSSLALPGENVVLKFYIFSYILSCKLFIRIKNY